MPFSARVVLNLRAQAFLSYLHPKVSNFFSTLNRPPFFVYIVTLFK